jgi:hypothetical protein
MKHRSKKLWGVESDNTSRERSGQLARRILGKYHGGVASGHSDVLPDNWTFWLLGLVR